MIGIVCEIGVYHFTDFEGLAGDEFDCVWEEIGNVAAFGHAGQKPFHGIEENGCGIWIGGV